MSTEEKSNGGEQEAFPVATIQPARKGIAVLMLQSKMWWLTLVCLLLAIYFAWSSIGSSGPTITIRFPEGHGLKSGDAIRHRGIDVGTVTAVELADDLKSVRATVVLEHTAAAIASEGSQFWIVRPSISLTSVSGLETAVGSKYIAVAPATNGSATVKTFDGLVDLPAADIARDGVMIRLQASRTLGVNLGSPVTCRGITVGSIEDVTLSRDAMSVDVIAQIDSKYRNLLCQGTKFWATSGVNVGFGLTGLKLNTDSLATIARGGISFITPESRNPEDLKPAEPGSVFVLHEKADSDWTEDAAAIQW